MRRVRSASFMSTKHRARQAERVIDLEALTPEHRRHIYEGEPEEGLIEYLEPDQLVEAMESSVPRRSLGRPAQMGLWALRIFVLVLAALVAFTFISGIVHGA